MTTKNNKFKTYYLLGIGGVSMSALAMFLKNKNCEVMGYDETQSRSTIFLEKNKIKIDFKFKTENLDRANVVVVSSAIKKDNPFYIYAKEKQKHIISRGELLGEIAKEYQKVVAIAGSHGKTTTTAMIYEILKVAGYNPSLHLGGFRLEDEKNFHIGEKVFFVTEACEYFDNFLWLFPYIGVITNIEKEHLDYFKTFENQKKSFKKFKKQSKIVVEKDTSIVAKYIRHDKAGNLRFSLYNNQGKIMRLHMKICEEINTENCIFAYKVAKILGLEDCQIKMGLENFKGVSTRFEKVESKFFDSVVCDYAHHPTEIEKSIKSAYKIYKNKQILVIFQPHTFSRTKSLLPEFEKIFEKLEYPIFFKTYSARENESQGISAKQLCENISKTNHNAQYFDNFDDLFMFLKDFDKENCMLLFLGAGDLPTILHKNKFIS